jgi:hypothetical protein
VEEGEMGRAYSINGEMRNACRSFGGKTRGKETTRKTKTYVDGWIDNT